MSSPRRILRIRWFHRVTNAEVTSQTEQEDLTSHIRRRRAAVFGHVRRLPEEAPGRMAMRRESTFNAENFICRYSRSISSHFCAIHF